MTAGCKAWLLTAAEWDVMIAELAAGPARKPDAAQAEAERIAERIIAARPCPPSDPFLLGLGDRRRERGAIALFV